MKFTPVQGSFYGKQAWSSARLNQLRKTDCLCLNCDNLKPEQPNNCRIAQAFYAICVEENVAIAVARCPLWKPKKS